MKLELSIDGRAVDLEAPPLASLLEVLRRALGPGEVARACPNGRCGACLVLLDDQPAAACHTPALHAHGRPVRTVRGCPLAQQLRPRQAQALPSGIQQCPTCVSAMIVVIQHLQEARDSEPESPGEDLRQVLAGIVCRCPHAAAQREAMLSAIQSLARPQPRRKRKKPAAKKVVKRAPAKAKQTVKASARKGVPKKTAAKKASAKKPVSKAKKAPTRKRG